MIPRHVGLKRLSVAFLIFLGFAAQALWSDLATLRLHTASSVEASIFLALDAGLALTALAAIVGLLQPRRWAALAVGAWFVVAAAFLSWIWWFLPVAVDLGLERVVERLARGQGRRVEGALAGEGRLGAALARDGERPRIELLAPLFVGLL